MAIVQRKCRVCDGWHYLDRWPHNCMPEIHPARSDLPAPHVIRDSLPGGINGLYHHGANKRIDSKAGYRQATKDGGYIEVGSERPHERRHTHVNSPELDIEADVAATVQEFVEKGIIA